MSATATARVFTPTPAVRKRVPVLVALCGPSSSGKTKSALRLGEGIAGVEGRPMYVIDTEGNRSLHYAEQHSFIHVPFDPPFSPADYLAVIEQVATENPGCIIIDSMSHEHEGEGGVLEMHEAQLDRMAGDDWKKREKCTAAAWIKPKQQRRRLIQRILQLNTNMIFCFRAAEKLDWKKGGAPEALGFQPIAPPAIIYEMTLMALFQPQAMGVPDWRPTIPGEKALVKLPNYLLEIFKDGRQMDEKHGEAIARWARGDSAGRPAQVPAPTREHVPQTAPPADKFEAYKTAMRANRAVCKAAKGLDAALIQETLKRGFDLGWDADELINALTAPPATDYAPWEDQQPTSEGDTF